MKHSPAPSGRGESSNAVKEAERVRQDKRQFVKAASTFQIRDWSNKTKPIHYYRRLAEEHMNIDTQRSKRWFSDLTNLELDNLAELVTGSSAFRIDAKYTARRALRDLVAQLWCVPPSSITEDDAWKCVKNDEQRHSHFLFNRTQASALRMRLAATVGLAGAGAPNPAPQGTQAPYMPNEMLPSGHKSARAGYSGGGGGGSQQQGGYSGVTTDGGGYSGLSGAYSKPTTPNPRSTVVRPTALQHSMQVPSAAAQAAGNPGLQPSSAFAALRARAPWLSQSGAAIGVVPPGLLGFSPTTWNPASAYGSPAAAQIGTSQQHYVMQQHAALLQQPAALARRMQQAMTAAAQANMARAPQLCACGCNEPLVQAPPNPNAPPPPSGAPPPISSHNGSDDTGSGGSQQQRHLPGLLRTTSDPYGMNANQVALASERAMAGQSSESAAAMPMPGMDLWRRHLHATTSSEAAHAAGNHLMAHLSSQAHQQREQQQRSAPPLLGVSNAGAAAEAVASASGKQQHHQQQQQHLATELRQAKRKERSKARRESRISAGSGTEDEGQARLPLCLSKSEGSLPSRDGSAENRGASTLAAAPAGPSNAELLASAVECLSQLYGGTPAEAMAAVMAAAQEAMASAIAKGPSGASAKEGTLAAAERLEDKSGEDDDDEPVGSGGGGSGGSGGSGQRGSGGEGGGSGGDGSGGEGCGGGSEDGDGSGNSATGVQQQASCAWSKLEPTSVKQHAPSPHPASNKRLKRTPNASIEAHTSIQTVFQRQHHALAMAGGAGLMWPGAAHFFSGGGGHQGETVTPERRSIPYTQRLDVQAALMEAGSSGGSGGGQSSGGSGEGQGSGGGSGGDQQCGNGNHAYNGESSRIDRVAGEKVIGLERSGHPAGAQQEQQQPHNQANMSTLGSSE